MSANPKEQDIGELARGHAADALEVLAEEMNNAFESRDRIRAAEAVLDRGYGKPSQAIIAIPASRRQAALLAGMSDDQLVAVIEQKQLPRLGGPQPMITVEAAVAAIKADRHTPRRDAHGPAADAYDDHVLDPLLT